jgi:hypothetical protein
VPLADAAEAHRQTAEPGTRGRWVLTV